MPKKKPDLKIRSLMLGDGYAETATHGCVLMSHRKGFESLQEALMDLNRLVVLYTQQEFEDNNARSYMPKMERRESVSEFIRTMIRGDFQESPAWDVFCEERTSQWGMAQNNFGFDWPNRVEINNAPSMIAMSPYWLERDGTKWPKGDPEIDFDECDDAIHNSWLWVLASYCDFANTKMNRKMFLGGYQPKRES